MMTEEENIARGRFTWARLVVTYKDGTTVFEDRSDENFWNDLPKIGISSLGVQLIGENSVKHVLKGSKNHSYGFFHYKKRRLVWGINGQHMQDVAFAIGIVVNKNGDEFIMEVHQDGSVFSFKSNVHTTGRNLQLHGIDLEMIE